MPSASLRFSGNLIEELSQKIPSSLFALNELVKNAYDAFSPDIIINISVSKKIITVADRGRGMTREEINSLFHISKSTKKYGHEIEESGVKRIVQGSKGLGFLSAFKFGDKVEWITTSKDGVRSRFSVSKSELVAQDDISGTKIPITEDRNSESGTIIKIFSTEENVRELVSDFSDERVVEKLVAAIIDDSFNIEIFIEDEGKRVSTKELTCFKREVEDSQLFYVKYNSLEGGVEFYHKGEKIKTLQCEISEKDYFIDIELIIFYFRQGKNSKKISPLNRRVNDDALYPLVYINRNIFNNTVIFDPDVLRKKSSAETLPQMIGRVKVRCQSEELDFNSDRTNFVENQLTRSLIKDLDKINKFIQAKGAELKNELKDSGKILTGKASPINDDSELKVGAALIKINRRKPTKFFVPSEQIDLRDYILKIRSSSGEGIKCDDVEIFIDGLKSENHIISSVEDPCEKLIAYRYNDKITGVVTSQVCLFFEIKRSSIGGKSQNRSLFTIQSGSDYDVRIPIVSEIINAIDVAYSSRNREEYLPIIACSIRSIFEISSDRIIKLRRKWFSDFDVKKFNEAAKKESKDKLLLNVIHVVVLLKKNPELMREISEVSGVSYSTLNNLLDVNSFKASVRYSHIGAHQSIRYLSKPKIEECADVCGYFSVICDVLLNSAKVMSLSINQVEESDINICFGLI